MKKKQFENENFILYSPDSLNYITKDMEQILNESLSLYKNIFNIQDFRKVQINYFDDIKEFRNFIYELRGEKESLPEYARGTFDKGMINAYIQPNIIEGTPMFNKKKYNASHELFHIMYKELILDKNNIPRIVWFDEGMAQLFSGQYKKQLKKENYDGFVKEIISTTKTLPNLNELSHGSKFETEEYSGYRLSLIAVKYLYDELGMDGFKKLLYDTNKICEYGEKVLSNIFKKYREGSDIDGRE